MSDTLAENKVVVNIFGEDYPITGVTDPSYISRVADFVDARMKEAAGGSRVHSRDRIAILAAMSLASTVPVTTMSPFAVRSPTVILRAEVLPTRSTLSKLVGDTAVAVVAVDPSENRRPVDGSVGMSPD